MSVAATSTNVYRANMTLRELVDNSEAEEAEGYRIACDECAGLTDEPTYDANDGLCGACYAKVHFTCAECGNAYHLDDQHADYPTLCVDCGCSKHVEIRDELADAVSETIESWAGDDNEINKLRKLLTYARKLK